MYQYQVSVNGALGFVTDYYPELSWARIAQLLEVRGGHAKLYRRLVTDLDILESLVDLTGYIVLRDKVICPWEVFAEIEDR